MDVLFTITLGDILPSLAIIVLVGVCIFCGVMLFRQFRKNSNDDSLHGTYSHRDDDEEDFDDDDDDDDDDGDERTFRITVYKENGEVLFTHEGKFEFESEEPGYVDYSDEYGNAHTIHAMSGFIKIDEV